MSHRCPRSSARIEQRPPEPCVGRSNRLGGTSPQPCSLPMYPIYSIGILKPGFYFASQTRLQALPTILSTACVTCGMVGVRTHALGSTCQAPSAAGRDTGYGIEWQAVA